MNLHAHSIPPEETSVTRLEHIFSEVTRAIDRGESNVALRLADRARRLAPQNPTCVLLHARLLMANGAATEAIQRLRGLAGTYATVTLAEALRMDGRWEEASGLCTSLLSQFAVDSVDGLRELADRLWNSRGLPHLAGWVGVDTTLRIVGRVRTGPNLSVQSDEVLTWPLVLTDQGNGFSTFVGEAPPGAHGRVTAFAGDFKLFGSGLTWTPSFGIHGWVYVDRSTLIGEVRCTWAPGLPRTLLIRVCPDASTRTVVIDPDVSLEHASFSIALLGQELAAARIEVAVLGPDGVAVPLLGSPLQKQRATSIAIGPVPQRAFAELSVKSTQRIDIVIPVYAGYDETLACLESVFATTGSHEAEIVVVDDHSPDPELSEALDSLAMAGRITLLRNTSNLGFPGAANRGMGLHCDRDVVLLNSDTVVFGDWLDRLRCAAGQAPEIGTVTPLGEAGSVTDYSINEGGYWAADIDSIARKVNSGKIIDLPVGVGFCLYIKRACLEETGFFDEVNFGRGYGEENDLCLCARRLGWRHVAATDVFVEHRGGRSFGKERDVLRARNSRVLNTLHPGYDRLIGDFAAADPLHSARRAIDMQVLLERAIKPVLLITLHLPGGVKRHVDERGRELAAAGHTVLVLQPCEERHKEGRLLLRVASLGLVNLAFDRPADSQQLDALLRECGLSSIEIHHLMGVPAEVLEVVAALGVPYTVYIHDYSWICPRITLVGGDGVYCGEPPVEDCERCIQTHGSEMDTSMSVSALRSQSASILAGAEGVIAPSSDAGDRMARYFPDVPVQIEPWEPSMPDAAPVAFEARAGKRVRVAVIGAIGIQKGHAVLLECARDAAKRGLELEFVVVGYTDDDAPLLATDRVFITGPYDEEEIGALLAREQCHIAFFASVSPETWCYSLTHALAHRLPVIAYNHGAIAERLLGYAATELLPLSTSPAIINDRLLHLAQIHSQKPQETAMDQPSAFAEELTASVQVLPLPEGIYSFTVKGVQERKLPPGQLAVPALQVSMAPAATTCTVEFLTGGASLDRWLAYESDMIVVRILGGEASLLLTSLRTPESPAMNVDVRRLQAEMGTPSKTEPVKTAAEETGPLPVGVLLHLKNIGDIEFNDGWAGWMGQRLWIEAFAIRSAGGIPPDLIEYRGVTADGKETPWLSNQMLCGSRGMGLPIAGYAVRLKSEVAGLYDCTYSGRFSSGATAGPFQDSALCCSTVSGDPLEGMEVQVVRRSSAQAAAD